MWSNSSQWICIECTYTNDASKAHCDMCLSRKPKESHSSHIIPSKQLHHSINDEKPNIYRSNAFKIGKLKNCQIGKLPNSPILPQNVTFNPTKPTNKQTVFERWLISQIERQSDQQPAICVKNNVILNNLRKVRAPTTWRTLQKQIDDNTSVMKHANNLDAADFTDDEEEEGLLPTHSHSPDSPDKFGQNNNNNNAEIADSSFTYHHKKLLNQRRRKKRNSKNKTVSQLWFKAQSQLKQGRSPLILAKHNVTLSNISQHNPRFKDYQRRKSHHEKAAAYLQVIGDRFSVDRRQIEGDEGDEGDDFSDQENYEMKHDVEQQNNLNFALQENSVEKDVVVTYKPKDDDDNKMELMNGAMKQFKKFLDDNGFEEYFESFRSIGCDISYIEDFDDETLMNDIGIKSKIKRKKFLRVADDFKIEMDQFNKIMTENNISLIISKQLKKFGIITLHILCNEVTEKNDLNRKFKIHNNSQCDLLWNIIQKQLNPQNFVNQNNHKYQNEGVQQSDNVNADTNTPYI